MRSKPLVMGWLGVSLTLLKPVVAWLVVALVINKRDELASVALSCLMISDVSDGIIFRKSTLRMQYRLGFFRRVVDALGDRFCIYLVFVTMIEVTNLPFYIYGVELVREVILISIVSYSWMVRRPILEPNNVSRTATFFTGLTAVAWLNSQQVVAGVFITLTAFIGTVGLWKYYQATTLRK